MPLFKREDVQAAIREATKAINAGRPIPPPSSTWAGR
jgi:hypothetical protein